MHSTFPNTSLSAHVPTDVWKLTVKLNSRCRLVTTCHLAGGVSPVTRVTPPCPLLPRGAVSTLTQVPTRLLFHHFVYLTSSLHYSAMCYLHISRIVFY